MVEYQISMICTFYLQALFVHTAVQHLQLQILMHCVQCRLHLYLLRDHFDIRRWNYSYLFTVIHVHVCFHSMCALFLRAKCVNIILMLYISSDFDIIQLLFVDCIVVVLNCVCVAYGIFECVYMCVCVTRHR